MDVDDARTIGRRVRRIREARGKSLRVIAGLAGMSKSQLNRIERGEVALDRISDITALAAALHIAPSELTQIPAPAPGNGGTDRTIEAIRLALDGIDVERPGGMVLPADVLADRVDTIHRQSRHCLGVEVAAALPGLIRDLHTTLDTRVDRARLLALGVRLHVHVTRMWLGAAGAPIDLRRRTVFLARRLARELDQPEVLAVAAFGTADIFAGSGVFGEAAAELDAAPAPPVTQDTAGLVAALLATRSLLAVVSGRPDDAAAPIDEAADIAARYGELGEADPLGFGFGPANVGFRRVRLALEDGDAERAARIAEQLDWRSVPFPASHVYHLVGHGRALARLRGRAVDAVRALRAAEQIYPHRVQRDPMVREALAHLLTRVPRDTVAARELRSMAYRSDLPV